MTNSVKGIVDNSFSKQKTSRAGKNFTIHYIEVDGVTVSTGFKKMFDTGEMVDIEVANKYNEWQYVSDGGKGLPAAAGGAPAKAVATPSFGPKGKFPVDPKDGQISIIRQSSMTRAVEIIGQLMHHGLFTPQTEEEYMIKLNDIAYEITDFSSGNDVTKLLKVQQQAKEIVNG